MNIAVHMLAFEDPSKVRHVQLPDEVAVAHIGKMSLLGQVFHYGQNDIQPQPICSVSVGDVIQIYDGPIKGNWLVTPSGFEKLNDEQYKQYQATPQRDRIFWWTKRENPQNDQELLSALEGPSMPQVTVYLQDGKATYQHCDDDNNQTTITEQEAFALAHKGLPFSFVPILDEERGSDGWWSGYVYFRNGKA